MKVQVHHVNAGVTGDSNEENAIISLKISCKNIDHYYSIVSKIRSIDGILDISRGIA